MNRASGFSLIEMMVVIAIVAILAVAGVALTSSWVKQAEITKTVTSLASAINLAKSTSIRNENGFTDNSTAAQICLNQNILSVYKPASSTTAASCSSTAIYSFQIPSNVQIKDVSNTTLNCIAFGHLGDQKNTSPCTTDQVLTITNGGLSETYTFN